jgi:hypothetical protein
MKKNKRGGREEKRGRMGKGVFFFLFTKKEVRKEMQKGVGNPNDCVSKRASKREENG